MTVTEAANVCFKQAKYSFSFLETQASLVEPKRLGMSRIGSCHGNAVAESFFQLLMRECIRHRIYNSREEARRDGKRNSKKPSAISITLQVGVSNLNCRCRTNCISFKLPLICD
jgi:hypothetical protein